MSKKQPANDHTLILGRASVVMRLWSHLSAGHCLLLHGPVGIGKSEIVEALAAHAATTGVAVGHADKVTELACITEALRNGYEAYHAAGAANQRKLRSRLKMAAERHAGILLLDNVRHVGVAARTFVKQLRDGGLGVLLCFDIEHPRDHARMRALKLGHREIELTPLSGATMRKILRERAQSLTLTEDDARSILALCEGRPGRLVRCISLLKEGRYWSGDRPQFGPLKADLRIAEMSRLMTTATR